jgi:hypothetical protein
MSTPATLGYWPCPCPCPGPLDADVDIRQNPTPAAFPIGLWNAYSTAYRSWGVWGGTWCCTKTTVATEQLCQEPVTQSESPPVTRAEQSPRAQGEHWIASFIHSWQAASRGITTGRRAGCCPLHTRGWGIPAAISKHGNPLAPTGTHLDFLTLPLGTHSSGQYCMYVQ